MHSKVVILLILLEDYNFSLHCQKPSWEKAAKQIKERYAIILSLDKESLILFFLTTFLFLVDMIQKWTDVSFWQKLTAPKKVIFVGGISYIFDLVFHFDFLSYKTSLIYLTVQKVISIASSVCIMLPREATRLLPTKYVI